MKRTTFFTLCSYFFLSMGSIIIFASSYYSLNKTHIGLAFALPPFIYYAFRRHVKRTDKKEFKINNQSSKRLFMLFIIIYLIFVSLSLLYWHSEVYHRPISFFILIAIIYVVIAGQILLMPKKKMCQ
jgi:hypothetical protein